MVCEGAGTLRGTGFLGAAELKAQSPDGAERLEAQAFYREQIEAGDPRAGLALVDLLLRSGELDGVSLERAMSVTQAPADRIALASLLFSTGLPHQYKRLTTCFLRSTSSFCLQPTWSR